MALKIVAENRQAKFNYFILETFEAGLALLGSEVKSIRDHKVQLKDSFVSFVGHEPYLQKAHISVYEKSSHNNHEPERKRKLLLNKSELNKISAALREKGLSCVPLKMYFKNGFVKLEIALVKGKKVADKRESIKKRDVLNEVRKSLRRER
jgi:SsrA-binding protein